MTPSFIAFLNKSGIVCAADTDRTIYQLSTEQPLAMAVNPSSRIPWDSLIKQYIWSTGRKPEVHELFTQYADDFGLFLAGQEVRDEWYGLTEEEGSAVFVGYGRDDLFPSADEVRCMVMDDGRLGFERTGMSRVGYNCRMTFSMLGNFDSVSPLLSGVTDDACQEMMDLTLRMFEKYRERVLERFRGTRYEEYITERLDEFYEDEEVIRRLQDATDSIHCALDTGVDTFSIEDLVSSAETIINANARLSRLHSGDRGDPVTAREIAVLTRHRGEELTWCKHSLYAL